MIKLKTSTNYKIKIQKSATAFWQAMVYTHIPVEYQINNWEWKFQNQFQI
jgi:hypothetical protein